MTVKRNRPPKRQTVSGHCIKCGVFRKTLHNDHIVPRWRGGLDVIENIQLLCANCHEDKSWEESHSADFKANHNQFKDPKTREERLAAVKAGKRRQREREAAATQEEKVVLVAQEHKRVAKIAHSVGDHWSNYSLEDRKARNATMSAGRLRAREAYAAMTPEEQAREDHRKALRRFKNAEKQLAKLRLLAEKENDIEALAALNVSKVVQ